MNKCLKATLFFRSSLYLSLGKEQRIKYLCSKSTDCWLWNSKHVCFCDETHQFWQRLERDIWYILLFFIDIKIPTVLKHGILLILRLIINAYSNYWFPRNAESWKTFPTILITSLRKFYKSYYFEVCWECILIVHAILRIFVTV